jgi:hypothetical protein
MRLARVTRAGSRNREPGTTGSLKHIEKEALMGSMMKADSDPRELVRERRQARMERKQQRRQARERKHSQISAPPPALSATQRAAQHEVDVALDRIVTEALERHDHITATADMPHPASTPPAMPTIDAPAVAERRTVPAQAHASSSTGHTGGTPPVTAQTTPAARGAERRPRRERDIAAFRQRRQQAADEARAEARERIARAGELACIADALAALAHPGARPWDAERHELERAIETGRIVEVGAAARRALWAVSRDAARSSRRARRDPDLALAACVAYAIIARLPRTALRSIQRSRPTPQPRPVRRRAFWR